MASKKAKEEKVEVEEIVEETHEVDPSVVRLDVSRMYASRATFDTSGLAGPADNDYRRAYAAWDDDITEEDEHLIHLKNGPESLENLRKNAYRP